MPENGPQDAGDCQQRELPRRSLFSMSGQSQLADGRAASCLWCLRAAYLHCWSACTCSLRLSWASRPFHSTSMCCHHHTQVCADFLRLSKGLVLASRSGCFCKDVDVFCLCTCMETVNRVGIFAWLLTKYEQTKYVCCQCHRTLAESVQCRIWYVLSCVFF